MEKEKIFVEIDHSRANIYQACKAQIGSISVT